MGVLVTILLTVTVFHGDGGCPSGGRPNHHPRIALLLMLQNPKMPTITRIVHVAHHRGEGKDLNELARMVTVIEGRQPPTLQGEGGVLNVFSKHNADCFGRKHTHHTTGRAGGKDLNYSTVMEESKPTKPQGRRICLTSQTCCKVHSHLQECWQLWPCTNTVP